MPGRRSPFPPRTTPLNRSEEELEAEKRTRHWTLNRTQRAFVDCQDPFSFFIGGIGSGKTFAGCVRAIMTATSDEYAGSMGVICAPTYPMLEDATYRLFMQLLPEAAIKRENKNSHSLVLVNDSTILFRSLDKPDALRGSSIAWFWDDEAPIGGYYAWQVLKGRLRQNRPDGTPYRVMAWATGTPKGRDEFYDDFENPESLQSGHRLFRSSTIENQRNLPADYIKNTGYTGSFYEQEILGLFTAFSGLVYRFDPSPTTGHIRTAPERMGWKKVIGGIDWGYNHPAAIIPLGIDSEDRVWQLAEYVASNKSFHDDLVPIILRFTREYGIETWWCDSALPGQIVDLNRALDTARVDCSARGAVKGPNSVAEGIQSVQRQLARRPDHTYGFYVAPTCRTTITQFGQYQYERTPDGRLRAAGQPEQPVKANDDAMDALRYAIHMTFGLGRTKSVPYAVSQAHQDDDIISRTLRETEGLEVAEVLRRMMENTGLDAELEERQSLLAARQRAIARFLPDLHPY